MAYTVACVPFMNAWPLVAWFEHLGDESPVRVHYDLPSRLPEMLESGQADAILVSSIDALTTPGREVASGVCIGTRGAAESVRLFSIVPYESIRTLALDESSMTSNALAQIVLAEKFGVRPECSHCTPDLDRMLSEHDAALLIGDKGLSADGTGLHILDLGQAWAEISGLPFVWALWTGRSIAPELSALFTEALTWAESNFESVVEEASERGGCDLQTCRRYLTETMNYRLEDIDLAGLRTFGEMLRRHKIATLIHFPEIALGAAPAIS